MATSKLQSDASEKHDVPTAEESTPRGRSGSRLRILVRRIHMYLGLFLLPWVLLYGVTGAMFNHQELFPQVTIQPVAHDVTADSAMKDFPTAAALAQQVVDSLQQSAGDSEVVLAADHGAEFTNGIMYEVSESGSRHVVHIDPVSRSSKIVTHPENEERLEPLLPQVRNISLQPDPLDLARESASQILAGAGIESAQNPRPFGWTKLNFMARVDGQFARITYVLKDGHVDVTRHTGEDGMTLRHFLLRLHTSHGQPPHWNGRMFWSLAVDTMAVAMVCWALTGLFMWWQIKRTRAAGGVVIVLSIITAALMYVSVYDFYVATKL